MLSYNIKYMLLYSIEYMLLYNIEIIHISIPLFSRLH